MSTIRNYGLDIIRATAILFVLLCHLSFPLYSFFKGSSEVVYNFGVWVGGYYGVEIFFVLSGFLIGGIFIKTIVANGQSERRKKVIGNFWMRRWMRTLPNYYLFLLVNMAVIIYTKENVGNVEFWKYLIFVQKINPATNSSFYGVSWSLAVEEWFYLLLPVFFISSLYLITNKMNAFIFSIAALFFVSFIQKLLYCFSINFAVADHIEAFHFSTFFRLDSIAFGVALAYIWSRPNLQQRLILLKTKLLWAAIFLILCSLGFAFLFLAKQQQNPLSYLFFEPLCSFAIVLFFPYLIDIKKKSEGIIYRAVTFLSLCSYSLYLSHIPLMMLIQYWTKDNLWFSTTEGSILKFGLLIFSASILSYFIYHYFEVPIINLRERVGKLIYSKTTK